MVCLLGMILVSCSGNGHKHITFKAERLYFQAEKAYKAATIKPELADSSMIISTREAYREVTDYCWRHLDSLPRDKYPEERKNLEQIAFMASNKLASFFNLQGQFDTSIVILRQLLAMTDLTDNALLVSRTNLARALQYKGEWLSALGIYRSILDTFYPPVDSKGDILYQVVNLHLELIQTDRLLRYDEEARQEEEAAEKYYRRLIQEWPNSQLETSARRNLAALFADRGQYDPAIEMLSQVKDSTGQRDFWAALRMAEFQADGKKDYAAAIEIYNALLAREKDSSLLANLNSRLGKTYFDSGNYRRCREIMNGIKSGFNQFYMNDPMPQKYIALALQKEGNWTSAENEFLWLITNFPRTEEAFDAYLSVAEHYALEGNKRLEESWLRRAEQFYDEMAARHSGTTLEASALSYKAEVARRRGDWKNAAELLERLYGRFPNQETGRRGLIRAATIYRERLGDINRADSLLKLLRPEI